MAVTACCDGLHLPQNAPWTSYSHHSQLATAQGNRDSNILLCCFCHNVPACKAVRGVASLLSFGRGAPLIL
eukprot:4960473-Amphidinium_carterae.1